MKASMENTEINILYLSAKFMSNHYDYILLTMFNRHLTLNNKKGRIYVSLSGPV